MRCIFYGISSNEWDINAVAILIGVMSGDAIIVDDNDNANDDDDDADDAYDYYDKDVDNNDVYQLPPILTCLTASLHFDLSI